MASLQAEPSKKLNGVMKTTDGAPDPTVSSLAFGSGSSPSQSPSTGETGNALRNGVQQHTLSGKSTRTSQELSYEPSSRRPIPESQEPSNPNSDIQATSENSENGHRGHVETLSAGRKN